MPLDGQGRESAQVGFWSRLLPIGDTGWTSIATSQSFGPFEPGSWIVITCDAPAHVNAGATAIATNPQLPAGVHDFVMPNGATTVALFGSGAGNAAAWQAS